MTIETIRKLASLNKDEIRVMCKIALQCGKAHVKKKAPKDWLEKTFPEWTEKKCLRIMKKLKKLCLIDYGVTP